MPSFSVDHSAVLDALYPFLLESGYLHTLRALQMESRRPCTLMLTTSSSSSGSTSEQRSQQQQQHVTTASSDDSGCNEGDLRRQVLDGKWDVVLSKYLSYCTVPQAILFALYENIFLEMLQLFQVETAARSFFRNSPVFRTMRRRSPAQHARLQQLLESFRMTTNPNANPGDVIHVTPHFHDRRTFLANELCTALRFVSFPELKQLNRLPWVVAADAASLFSDAAAAASPKSRPREDSLESGELVPKMHRAERNSTTDTLEANAIASAALLPSKLFAPTISFASSEDPGLSVTSTRYADIGAAGCGALTLKTNGTVAWTPSSEGSSCVEAFLSAPGGHAALCVDLDTSVDKQQAGGSGVWAAIGFRGGAVRVFDCEVRKLARKIENLDPLGVHCITFCGPENAIRGHRGYLVGATFSGNLVLLSVEQGACLATIPAPHNGSLITSVARCLVPRRESVDAAAAAAARFEPINSSESDNDDEVFVTCADNGTMLRWCATLNTKQQMTAVDAYPRPDLNKTSSSSTQTAIKNTPWRLDAIHTDLAEELPVAVTGLQHQKRGSWRDRGADWIAVSTKGGHVAVHSLSLNVALLVCRLDRPVSSIALGIRINAATAAGATNGEVAAFSDGDSARNILVASAVDGVLYGFNFHAFSGVNTDSQARKSLQRKTSVVRSEADAQSTAIAEDIGGAVEGLVISLAPPLQGAAGAFPLLCAVSPILKKQFVA
ncbi:Hypothetical protein, putative [Bodo saltans]|uniref:Uncharacterized protein n=1 Tax=Bodo saltans TaxID=75058 RepID=A0A0S4JXF7_BODSA|nr:Hypothetical protein, putative [Bodo saltans]|eukprot:CUG94119.1 Hypothetical protein, putative [Bodo saltans]